MDGGSVDRTCEVVRSFEGVQLLHSPKGRALQMNLGASKASGEILWFLHADTVPPADFLSQIRQSMDSRDTSAGCFYLKFDEDHPVLRLYSKFSRINHTLFTYGDQAIFVKRSVFREIGGYESLPIMEDLEIQKRLKRKGKFAKIDAAVITSARKFTREGIIWNQVKNIILVLLYLMGVSPRKLARHY